MITFEHVSKAFDSLKVLNELSFHVSPGQIVGIVGPSGVGKTTILKLITGILTPDSGTVVVGDTAVGYVFQEPRLLPWRDVLTNVAFPLELAGVGRAEREARAREVLTLTGLDGFARAYPDQLSGGMAQRAALARALVLEPDVLLLDEPFSALDAMTRERLDAELLSLWGQTGTTIVLVTHSISEAVYLSDRVLVMSERPGRIVAEVPVAAPRPRTLSGAAGTTFSRAADEVRARLASSEGTAAA